jgi:isoleucyl-tRNA synthetase
MEKETKPAKSEVSEKEEKILQFWRDNKIFEKSLAKDAPNGDFVFYDGPPFATGLPHYGHILPGTVKDIIPRYQTMRGKKVARKWGWDCHGLPIENLVEKELGLKSKKDIEEFGVENFNNKAKGLVMRYADDWKKIIPRTGRWADMENDYKTMDTSYTESVWWAFKVLYEKNLIYTAFKAMLLCPHCETTLSNFEVNQGYKDITDISVYVKFELADEPNTFFLAWTTTPWTLPGNVALAVGKDIEYQKVKFLEPYKNFKKGETYFGASEFFKKIFPAEYYWDEKIHHVSFVSNEDKIDVEVAKLKGKDLLGKSYKPLFDYYNNDKLENRQNGFKVYAGDFVTTTDGTGIVHIAPAFGEDDLNLGKAENLPFIQHVAFDGTFKKEVADFAGQKVKPKDDHQKADIEIIKFLAGKGTLFEKEKFVHPYPHCWRCDTPLLNYATTSWFLKVTDLKDRLVKINQKIKWNPPEIGSGRFGKWLEGARDWAISRTRYWGAALPVWQNEAGERTVIGGIGDLKDGIGRRNKYFLARHGESESNAAGRIVSCKKENKDPLTEKGREEVSVSAKKLAGDKNAKIDMVFCSPFLRTRETAEIIAGQIGFDKDKIIFDDRLGEISCGDWNGKPWSELDPMQKNDGAESLEDVRIRVMKFMYEIDEKYSDKNILIVTHGAPLNLISLGAEGLSTKDIMSHYYDNTFRNAEIRVCDFVALPHGENFEINLHRPYIDQVVLRDKKGEVLKRTPEVFDCWLESGSMSFAQNHYPFENKELFERKNSPLFPADFICESMDQTRGWFYTTLVLGVGLFDKSPYNQVVVSGMILAEDGRKMSKSLNNYPDMEDLLDKYGADSLRYYLVSSPSVKAEDMNFSERGVDEISKKVVQKTQNVLSFYEMYRPDAEIAGAFSVPDADTASVLDRWILSRLFEFHKIVTESLDKYRLDRASRPVENFVDDLSVWYLRRSRDRLKSENVEEKTAASQTMRFVLLEFSKIIAPLMPFLAEEIFQSLKTSSNAESVHLENWPDMSKIKFDAELIEKMKRVRATVTSALELRQKTGIKVRQPLAKLTIAENFSPELLSIIADEVNVKEIKTGESLQLDTEISDELKAEGMAREIIRAVQDVRKKENLNPTDIVSLSVCTDDFLKNILEQNQKNILSVTLATKIFYSTEKQKHTTDIDGHPLSVSVAR